LSIQFEPCAMTWVSRISSWHTNACVISQPWQGKEPADSHQFATSLAYVMWQTLTIPESYVAHFLNIINNKETFWPHKYSQKKQDIRHSCVHLVFLCLFLVGIGIGMLCVSCLVCLYYNVIIAWTFYYLASSLQSPLPWSCDAIANIGLCGNITTNSSAGRGLSPTEKFWK